MEPNFKRVNSSVDPVIQNPGTINTTNKGSNNRTIAKDVAKLIRNKKVTEKELQALDKDLRAEAVAFASTMEDEPAGPITLRKVQDNDPNKKVSPEMKLRQTPPHKVEVKPLPPKPKPMPSPPPPKPEPKPVFSPPPQSPINEEDKIKAELNDLMNKKVSLDQELNSFLTEKNALSHTISMIKMQESEVEEEENKIRRDLSEPQSLEAQKTLEERIWTLEDRRQVLEKDRWTNREKEDELDDKIRSKKKEQVDLESQRKDLEGKLNKLVLKKQAEQAKIELAKYEEEQHKVLDRKKKYELDWQSLNSVISNLEIQLEEKQKNLKEQNKTFESIEKKEHSTSSEKERHQFEEKRWETDKSIRTAQKEIWDVEEELNKKNLEKKNLEETFASIQVEEEEIVNKIYKAKAVIARAE